MGRHLLMLASAALLASCGCAPNGGTAAQPRASDAPGSSPAPRVSEPLAGRTVVLDPGHQLGNAGHPREINQLVEAGGFRKPCNTTGTATDDGYPEATFTYRVARFLRQRLEARGATVVLTRTRNSRGKWGPCVDVRGRAGNRHTLGLARPADAKVSIHGDGASSDGHGFHVIAPQKRSIREDSFRLGRASRDALRRRDFTPATYVARGTGLMRRNDLGTLNLSRVPAVMVELGNMRNPRDAKVMRSKRGQQRYARALGLGLENFLAR